MGLELYIPIIFYIGQFIFKIFSFKEKQIVFILIYCSVNSKSRASVPLPVPSPHLQAHREPIPRAPL